VNPRERPGQMLYARVIFHMALGLMRKLRRDGTAGRNDRASFRNALMLALLVSSPLRRKNLAALSMGTTLRQSSDGWRIYFPSGDVKNGRPIDYEVAPKLVPLLEFYLHDVRPTLLGMNASNALWINAYGNPMKDHALWLSLTEFTEKHFGVHISPHDLRSVTATMLAHESEDHALAAAALLGHHDSRVTEKHYLKARNIEASRRANEVLESVRKRSLDAGGRSSF
ncbi:MAG: tyrosine-type recombinase/integrase, partial [Rhizomicrobium sp.]